MVVNIELKPIKYKVSVGGYGSFEISPLGAGAEAEMRIALREAMDSNEQLNTYGDYEQFSKKFIREDGTVDTDNEEYKQFIEVLEKAGDNNEKLQNITLEKLRKVFKGDNVDKLFDELTLSQIQDIYNQAKAGKGE